MNHWRIVTELLASQAAQAHYRNADVPLLFESGVVLQTVIYKGLYVACVPLLPRAWSRALIPFPFPFERLPRRLSLLRKTVYVHIQAFVNNRS